MRWLLFSKEKYCTSDVHRLTITTEAETDLWQKTFYNGEADNAPMLLMSTDEQRFSFTVKAEFSEFSLAEFDADSF